MKYVAEMRKNLCIQYWFLLYKSLSCCSGESSKAPIPSIHNEIIKMKDLFDKKMRLYLREVMTHIIKIT